MHECKRMKSGERGERERGQAALQAAAAATAVEREARSFKTSEPHTKPFARAKQTERERGEKKERERE